LVDLDGDGKLDVISGSYSPGELYLFRGKGNGEFAEGEVIKDSTGKALNAGSASAPFAVDWDGDGDLDLIVGNIDGVVSLAINNGTREKPSYALPIPMRAADKPIKLGGDAGPTVADWDGDGMPDLLVGDGSGQVMLYRGTNRQKNGIPRLTAGRVLVPGSNGVTGSRMKLCVTDFNGDGKLDLLAGDIVYNTQPARQLTPEQAAQQQEAMRKFQQATTEYQRAVNEAMGGPARLGASQAEVQKKMLAAENDPKVKELRAKYLEALEQVQKFQPRTQYHGYVWLFARQDAPQRASASAR
jgi:hypothetical protein